MLQLLKLAGGVIPISFFFALYEFTLWGVTLLCFSTLIQIRLRNMHPLVEVRYISSTGNSTTIIQKWMTSTSLIRARKTLSTCQADKLGGEKLTFVYNYGMPVSNSCTSLVLFTLKTSTVHTAFQRSATFYLNCPGENLLRMRALEHVQVAEKLYYPMKEICVTHRTT